MVEIILDVLTAPVILTAPLNDVDTDLILSTENVVPVVLATTLPDNTTEPAAIVPVFGVNVISPPRPPKTLAPELTYTAPPVNPPMSAPG